MAGYLTDAWKRTDAGPRRVWKVRCGRGPNSPAAFHAMESGLQDVMAPEPGQLNPVDTSSLVFHASEKGENMEGGDAQERAYNGAGQDVAEEVHAEDDA